MEWLGSTTTNRHGVAAFDFATVCGCDQLIVGLIHARGGTLDHLMTDVADLVRAAVVAPIGNSDHSSLSAVISIAQAVPNLCVSRKVFLKHQVNWNTVCGAIRDLPWLNIWLAVNPAEILNKHLSLLVGRYIPTKVNQFETRISLGLMINAGMLLASSRRLIFGGSMIVLWLTWKSLYSVKLVLMTQIPSVSLVTETGMFLRMFFPLISGGSLLSLQCSARVRHCLHSLVRCMVDWCVSRLV